MRTPPIAYNLVRLVLASMHTTPRGIDRIDFGYLSHLFRTWPADCVGVMPTILGMRCFSREMVLAGCERLMKIWSENGDIGEDAAWNRFCREMAGEPVAPLLVRKRGMMPSLAGLARMRDILFGGGIDFGAPMEAVPRDAIYLDVGHFGVTVPGAFRWLRRRSDVKPVFLIHDAIPIEYPELVAADTVKAHHKVMAIAARRARAILTPTAAAGLAIRSELARHGRGDMPIFAVPLPIDPLFSRSIYPESALAAQPYFVVCGAIEPRKNHALLFDVWEELVRRMGSAAPRLVIAGSPGHASSAIMARIPGGSGRASIVWTSGLSSPAIARLLAGARAVLMPSFAEGFGLPPVEGLAVGTPAILSDIDAHRESAGEYGIFLPVDDRDGWLRVITSLATDDAAFSAAKQRISTFRPINWLEYMATIGDILRNLPSEAARDVQSGFRSK